MRLFVCGDIMPGGVLVYQNQFVSSGLQRWLNRFDFRIGTLEAAIGTDIPFYAAKMENRANIIYARDDDFSRIRSLGFDVLSLANNHIFDLGAVGLQNTIRQLDAAGIRHCGAGMNLEEASRPAVVERDGVRVAFYACSVIWNGDSVVAGPDSSGVNGMEMERILCDIRKAKKEHDWVIVLPHWGKEYTFRPFRSQIAKGCAMIDAGADAVFGSHAHNVQPIVLYKRKPICFNMGNFLFPDFYMRPPRPIWYPERGEDLQAFPVVYDYPFPISEPVRRVWNSVSRYGYCLDAHLKQNKRMGLHPSFVHLSSDNIAGRSCIPLRTNLRLFREKVRAIKIINNEFI